MKHFFLFSLFLFSVATSNGQFNYLHGLSYRVDTFHFYELAVPMQRYDRIALDAVPEKNIKERILAANIGYLQGSLDQMNAYILAEKDVFHNVTVAEGNIREIKNSDPTFDCKLYEDELYTYKGIADGRYVAAEIEKQKEASERAAFVQAQESETQKQKDEEEAWIAALQQHADSLEAIAIGKEIKKQQKDILRRYGPVNGKAINKGKVLLGMTPAMCELAWGKPLRTLKSTTVKGTTERWIYTQFQYLTFTNGKVSAIHEGGVVDSD